MSTSSSFGNPHSSPQDRGLSPLKAAHERSLSRPSSRSSISLRAPSPVVSFDDPVAVRNQISTLKHTIRHQQAQVHELENVILRGPRPYSDLSEPVIAPIMSTPIKMSKRSSFEVLQSIAGPDSNLPLPRREMNGIDENGIREGIPMSFGAGSVSPTSHRRTSSPTRTLSRIPVAAVGNAKALTDEGVVPLSRSTSSAAKLSPSDPDTSHSSLQPPPSPSRRLSLTPGGTTKVLADLQTGVVNARNALENTKAQLRLSQRTVAQLTRQTEDLKEGRERLRLENEGLNNVVARKERLLQEVLERARKAEAEASALRSQLKSDTTQSKKSLREMESALSESTALSQKCEREYVTLRDSLKSMTESWKTDTDRLKEDMRRREERWKTEAENMGKKYRQLVEEVKASTADRESVKELKEKDAKSSKDLENAWKEEIAQMKAQVEKSSKDGEEAAKTARELAAELARLRRLMQHASLSSTNMSEDSSTDHPP